MMRLVLKLAITILAFNSNEQQLFVQCSNDTLFVNIRFNVYYFLVTGGFITKYPSLNIARVENMILAFVEQNYHHDAGETEVDDATIYYSTNYVLSSIILPFIATEHIIPEYQTKHDISSSGYTIKSINKSHTVYMAAVYRLSSSDQEYDQNYDGLTAFEMFSNFDTMQGFGIFLNATDQMIGMTLVLQEITSENLTTKHQWLASDFEPLDQLQMPIHFILFCEVAVVMKYQGNKLASKLIETVFNNFDSDTIFALHVETTSFVAINCYLNHDFVPVRLVHHYYGLNRHGYLMVRIPSILINEISNHSDIIVTSHFPTSLRYQTVVSTVTTGFSMDITQYHNQIPVIYIRNKRTNIFHQFQATKCVSKIFCTVSTLWEKLDASFSLHDKNSKHQVFQVGIFFDQDHTLGKEFVYSSFSQPDYIYHHLRIDLFFKMIEDGYQISVRFIPQQGQIKQDNLRHDPLLIPISHANSQFDKHQISMSISTIHILATNPAIINPVIQFENHGVFSFLSKNLTSNRNSANHPSTPLILFILSTYLNKNVHLSRDAMNGQVFVHYVELLKNYCNLYEPQTVSVMECITSLPVWKYLYEFSETVHNLKQSPSDLSKLSIEISVDKPDDYLRHEEGNLKFDKKDAQFDFKTIATIQTVPFETVIQSQTWFSNASDVFGMNNGMIFFLNISNTGITRDQLFSYAENKLNESYPGYATDANKYIVSVDEVEYVYDVASITFTNAKIDNTGIDVDANTSKFELQGILVMEKRSKPLFYNPKHLDLQVFGDAVYAIVKFHNSAWYNCSYQYSDLGDACVQILEQDINTVYHRKLQRSQFMMETTDVAYILQKLPQMK